MDYLKIFGEEASVCNKNPRKGKLDPRDIKEFSSDMVRQPRVIADGYPVCIKSEKINNGDVYVPSA